MPLTGQKKLEATKRGQVKLQEKKREELASIIDDLMDDVEVFITRTENGKQRVTFDMGADTQAALEMVASAKGTTLDAILRGVISKNLLEAAKLRQVKEWAQRAAAREQQRAKRDRDAQEAQAARTAKIAELEAIIANQPARDAADQEAMQEAFRKGLPFKFGRV